MEEEAEGNWFFRDRMLYCAMIMCFIVFTFHVRAIASLEMKLLNEVTISGAVTRKRFACVKMINFAFIWSAKFTL